MLTTNCDTDLPGPFRIGATLSMNRLFPFLGKNPLITIKMVSVDNFVVDFFPKKGNGRNSSERNNFLNRKKVVLFKIKAGNKHLQEYQ